jgi:hypothetical protein
VSPLLLLIVIFTYGIMAHLTGKGRKGSGEIEQEKEWTLVLSKGSKKAAAKSDKKVHFAKKKTCFSFSHQISSSETETNIWGFHCSY